MLFRTGCNVVTDRGRAFNALPCPGSTPETALAWFCLWITQCVPLGFVVNRLRSLVWPLTAAPCQEAQHGPHSPAWPWHTSHTHWSTCPNLTLPRAGPRVQLCCPPFPFSTWAPAQARCWASAHLAPLIRKSFRYRSCVSFIFSFLFHSIYCRERYVSNVW